MIIKAFVVLSAVMVAAAPSLGQGEPSVGDFFEGLHAAGKYNGTVLVVQSGEEVYQGALGYARGDKTQVLTVDHLFQVGSIYKEFPAVAIMQLVEQGRLKLEDKLADLVPELPGWAEQVQVLHLLQYSSGLPLVDWPALFGGETGVSFDAVLGQLPEIQSLEFRPGSDYLYSNYNPFLLMRVVEELTEQTFAAYLQASILDAHEIQGVVLEPRYPFADTLARVFARPFGEDFSEDDLAYELPSICASLRGLQQWFEKLDAFQIVSKESMLQLSQEAKEGDNIQAPLGRGDWEGNELRLHLHHGSTGNYECLVRHYKQDGVLIVLLTNQKHRNLHEIADKVLGLLGEAER